MKAKLLPDNIINKLTPAQRKEFGVLTLDERHNKRIVKVEKELQRLVEWELNRRGIAFLHLSYRAREKIGWPDLVFCFHGRPIAVELKIGKKKPTLEQERMLAKMSDNGWETYVLYDFDSFLYVLSDKKKGEGHAKRNSGHHIK